MAKRKIRELTTGVHDFPTLIKGQETKYVDKTAILYELARKKEDAQCFLSRPRRFGKSLMLSTLQAMFEGRKSLFKGLEIYDKPWEGWTAKNRHPVYNFSMLRTNGATVDNFRALANNYTYKLNKKAPANKKITPKAVSENTVYFVDYNANQTYMREHFRGEKFNTKNEAVMDIFNEYFGGSMNAIVFQEMREKRSLAYSAQSYYATPSDKDGYFTNAAIIATQNDKLIDAMNAFNELFDQMPVAEANFNMAKDAEISAIRTARTTKMGIINSYLYYERMGFNPKKNHAKMLFEAYPNVTMKDVVNFNHKYIKGQKKVYMCLGKEADMDFNALAKFGKVKKLKLEDIFGY